MTTFTPTSIVTDPAPDVPDAQQARADRLGNAALRSLLHGPRVAGSLGLIRTLLYGVATFGLMPLLNQPRRFLAHVRLENEQLSYTGQWLERVIRPDADAPAEPDYPPPIDRRLIALSCAARGVAMLLAVIIVGFVWQSHAHWRDILGATWGTWGIGRYWRAAEHRTFFSIWCVGMTIGYGLDIAAVLLHERTRRRRLTQFNAALARASWFRPIRMPFADQAAWMPVIFGALIGLLLLAGGAVWGLPMMLASGVHSRYTSIGGRHVRRALRYRARLALAADDRLAARVRAPRSIWYGCTGCGEHVPSNVLACPQCGTPVNAESPAAMVRA